LRLPIPLKTNLFIFFQAFFRQCESGVRCRTRKVSFAAEWLAEEHEHLLSKVKSPQNLSWQDMHQSHKNKNYGQKSAVSKNGLA
jgi:hypothetical protein